MVALPEHRPTAAERLAGRTSRVELINIHEIGVEIRFQRALDASTVKKIKGGFHPAGVGIILVVDLGGGYAGTRSRRYLVLDGQTRVVSIQELIEQNPERVDVPRMILAEVFEGLEEDECALLFRLRNTQKLVAKKDGLRLLETEMEPIALQVRDDAASVGYVAFSTTPSRPSTLTAQDVSMARQIVTMGQRRKRPNLLVDALTVHATAFAAEGGGTLAGTINPRILQAVARVLLKNPQVTADMLAARLDSIQAISFDAKTEIETGVTSALAYQRVLAARYNRGRHRNDGKGGLLRV